MSVESGTIGTGGARPPATVRVWDPFVRVFHWSLASLFALAFFTGDEIGWLHLVAGYAIAGLLVLRIVWGLVGPEHARFSNFVRSPRDVLNYLRDITLGRAKRYLGHNPAGGAMIVALLVLLAAISVTGYMMTTAAFWGAQWAEGVHEALANITLCLIGLHVAGVVIASLTHNENLMQAMFTGRKRADLDDTGG